MVFALAALLVIAWSLAVMWWSVTRRTHAVTGVSLVLIVVLGASVVEDLSAVTQRARARDAGVSIVIEEIGDWYRLNYRRGNLDVATANEVHVPVGERVWIVWNGQPPFVLHSRDFLSLEAAGSAFVATRAGTSDVLLVGLWPPKWRSLRFFADPPDVFDRWLAREMSPVPYTDASFLFENSGCGFCHVIRGVTESPSTIAPDLTHFGSRRTIAATGLPNRRGALFGWIANSGALKRSSRMPESPLDAATLNGLVTYLESLR